jgi:hypothetical protein
MVAPKYLEQTLKGVKWKIYLQTHAAYVRKHGKDSKCIVYPDDKEMYLDKSELRASLIRHEVFHAFIASTDTENSSKMTADDMEELACTVYGNNSHAIEKVTDAIIDFIFKRL